MKLPVLFVGHGSPMNAVEDNEFTDKWKALGKSLPRPNAILAVSAHWYTASTRTSDTREPRMIYDMYGFPKELYDLKYPVEGSPELAGKISDLLKEGVITDNRWGIDHGTWSVLCRMYPDADIPVVQLSIDFNAAPEAHFETGRKLAELRKEGVLIIGSGNVVHNLSLINWGMSGGFDWAHEFDDYVKQNILNRNFEAVVNYGKAGKCAEKAFYTPDHFYPLLYVLGAADSEDDIEVFNDSCIMGSMSMTGYLFG